MTWPRNYKAVETLPFAKSVTIDGQPAGVAPVYPWVYTGGVDPFLWEPIPGVQTLNFVAYRVDLTPFAGVLSNGQPHTVALSVHNVDSYFSATATLLLYLDHGSEAITGKGPWSKSTRGLRRLSGVALSEIWISGEVVLRRLVHLDQIAAGIRENRKFHRPPCCFGSMVNFTDTARRSCAFGAFVGPNEYLDNGIVPSSLVRSAQIRYSKIGLCPICPVIGKDHHVTVRNGSA